MDNSNSINQTAAIASTTNALAAATSQASFVPCVPIAVSTSLVATHVLAKRLASTAPELAHLSFSNFTSIQFKKSELHRKTEECAATRKALLDVFLLNVGDLFANLSAYVLAQGHVSERSDNENLQSNLQTSLKRVHDYAASMDLLAADYCVDGVIYPAMLFDACLKRLQLFQKHWQDNYFQSIGLDLQLQRDALLGAGAACLTEICQYGLDNQITLESTPQTQEDVLVALATFVDAPFSGAWPKLRERTTSLKSAGGAQ